MSTTHEASNQWTIDLLTEAADKADREAAACHTAKAAASWKRLARNHRKVIAECVAYNEAN